MKEGVSSVHDTPSSVNLLSVKDLSYLYYKVPKEGPYCAEVRAHLRPGKSTFVSPRNDNDVQVRHYL